MTIPNEPRRRWFRFSLRTFFVVLTIFCVWLGVQVKWIRDRHEVLRHHWIYDDGEADRRAPWSIRILGEKGVEILGMDETWDRSSHQDEFERLQKLFPEASVEPMSHPSEPE